ERSTGNPQIRSLYDRDGIAHFWGAESRYSFELSLRLDGRRAWGNRRIQSRFTEEPPGLGTGFRSFWIGKLTRDRTPWPRMTKAIHNPLLHQQSLVTVFVLAPRVAVATWNRA